MKKIWVVIIVSIIVAVLFYGVGRAHEKNMVKNRLANGNGNGDPANGDNANGDQVPV